MPQNVDVSTFVKHEKTPLAFLKGEFADSPSRSECMMLY